MNKAYRNLINQKKIKQFSENAARAGYGNRMAFGRSITSQKPVQESDMRDAAPPRQIAFNTTEPVISGSIGQKRAEKPASQSMIYKEEIGGVMDQLELSFSKHNILSGIIFSEILGKPRCKRRKL
ncbi:MAG: hypothetical protein GX045_00910 [Clostridiaceae bacterium]|jgi:hypothetical protein|nr:hypothetical protein [Clostridiaceae bacterium]